MVAGVQKSLLDVIYKELALDSSVVSHSDTAARIHAMFLGEEGLVANMRSLNPGRPGGSFEVFCEEMGKVLEKNTAPDDRRHGIAMVITEGFDTKSCKKVPTEYSNTIQITGSSSIHAE